MESSKVDLIDATYTRCAEELAELNHYAGNFLKEMNAVRNNLKIIWSQENNCRQNNLLAEVELENFTTRLDVVRIMAQKLILQFKFYVCNFMLPDEPSNLCSRNMQALQYVSVPTNEKQVQPFDTQKKPPEEICKSEKEEPIVVEQELKRTISYNRTSDDIYRNQDLTNFVIGTTFRAHITYIENLQKLIFYVCQVQDDKLSALCEMRNLPVLWRLPSTEELFAISLSEDEIWRAIRLNQNNDILLIDIGEVVSLQLGSKLYRLPEEYVHIPPQAFKCCLVNIVQREGKPNNKKDDLSKILLNFEYKSALFRVTNKENGILIVEILSLTDWAEDDAAKEKQNINVKVNTGFKSNPFIDWNSDEEEKLQKESACTSVKALALKNDNTIATSKEEVLEQPSMTNGNTIATSKEEVLEQPSMKNGEIVKVLVTHICDIITFFAQAAVQGAENYPVCWDDNDLKNEQKLTTFPAVNDLLLAKYASDGLWYRAKVTGVNQQTKLITVFFVDFGNEETVRLGALASCSYEQKSHDFRAVRFTLANIKTNLKYDYNIHKRVLQSLSLVFMNEEIELKVLYLNDMDDLVVELVDKDLQTTVDVLLADNFG